MYVYTIIYIYMCVCVCLDKSIEKHQKHEFEAAQMAPLDISMAPRSRPELQMAPPFGSPGRLPSQASIIGLLLQAETAMKHQNISKL